MNTEINSAIKNYKEVCDYLVRLFIKQMGLKSNYYWVADKAGTIADVSEYFVDMETIITALENNVNFDTFSEWYDYNSKAWIYEIESINFESWIKGCPHLSEEEIFSFEKEHFSSIKK